MGVDDVAIAELSNGWTIIDARMFVYGVDRRRLAKLSRGAEVMSVYFQPNVMVSGADQWLEGRLTWSVGHDSWKGRYDFQVKGEPPSSVWPLHERQRLNQDDAGGEEADEHHLIAVPLLLGQEICGYMPGEPPFPHFTRLDPDRTGLLNRLAALFRP